MSKTPAAAKPPTQYAGVVGIEAKPVTLNVAPSEGVDWFALCALPPFQMFAAERRPNAARGDSELWAREFVRDQVASVGDSAVLDAYTEWHRAKGYWPGEDAFGRAL